MVTKMDTKKHKDKQVQVQVLHHTHIIVKMVNKLKNQCKKFHITNLIMEFN